MNDQSNEARAEINTSKGVINLRLFPEKAPVTVASFSWAIRVKTLFTRVLAIDKVICFLRASVNILIKSSCAFLVFV